MQSRVHGGRLHAQKPRLFRHFLYTASLIALTASAIVSPRTASATQLYGHSNAPQQVVPEIRNLNFPRIGV